MRTVLVTGGTGFLGSNLAEALVQRGCLVKILRRPASDLRAVSGLDVEFVEGDILDPESLKHAVKGCDTVFHTAALVSYWKRRRDDLHRVNVAGTRNIAAAALAAGVGKFIHTSSIAAIGFAGDGQLADETTPFDPGEHDVTYRATKRAAEVEIFHSIGRGLPGVIVNPSVIMGPRDLHFHSGQIIRDVYRKKLFYYVRGGVSIVDVGDVVRGHLAAAERGRIGEKYILAGENLTHQQILRVTAEVVGGLPSLIRLPMPAVKAIAGVSEMIGNVFDRKPWIPLELIAGINQRRWYSSDKAKRELGHAVTPFRVTVRRTFEWYRENGFL